MSSYLGIVDGVGKGGGSQAQDDEQLHDCSESVKSILKIFGDE